MTDTVGLSRIQFAVILVGLAVGSFLFFVGIITFIYAPVDEPSKIFVLVIGAGGGILWLVICGLEKRWRRIKK